MKWKIDTKKINGKHYVTGFHYSTNHDERIGLLEVATPPKIELLDSNRKLQNVVTINDDNTWTISIEEQALTEEELTTKKHQYVSKRISEKYSPSQEMALHRRQILGLDNTGWKEYTDFVNQVIAESEKIDG
jgi:hypothetical protein